MAFQYHSLFPISPKATKYRKLDIDGVRTSEFEGQKMLVIEPNVITELTKAAITDVSHLLRTSHLQQLRHILDDESASPNDHFVAKQLLMNATVAANMILPSCQDTGTAIVMGKKGQQVFTLNDDTEAIYKGVYETYTGRNLRYSQLAPLSTYQETNTKCNLPAQVDLLATEGNEYHFLFVTKGGGSANKTYLYQETKALLNPERMHEFLREKIKKLGTAACPPYHLAIVIGGLSAENNLKTVKLASCRYLDGLPTEGNAWGHAIRDTELEQQVLEMTRQMGIGAQFGGKYFCHDVRVIRLPRHGASCPVGIGVSCSADRQILGKITEEGVFLEELERNPARFLPEITDDQLSEDVVKIDLSRPMTEIRAELTQYPIKTRLSLSGTMIVARDIAHARILQILKETGELPDYFKKYPVYYAGPAKTPEGYASGSFGPTTASRMDPYVRPFQEAGGSFVMIAKGNRGKTVTDSCKDNGGFYLGSIGGPAAILAKDNIRKIEVLDFPELGMEAVWKIEVEDFPAFIVVDDKGNDFFKAL
ncbi:MAG: fumarate hydratase [Myxococcota bacterium]